MLASRVDFEPRRPPAAGLFTELLLKPEFRTALLARRVDPLDIPFWFYGPSRELERMDVTRSQKRIFRATKRLHVREAQSHRRSHTWSMIPNDKLISLPIHLELSRYLRPVERRLGLGIAAKLDLEQRALNAISLSG